MQQSFLLQKNRSRLIRMWFCCIFEDCVMDFYIRFLRFIDDLMRSSQVCGWDLAKWLECLTSNAKVATVLGPIPASSDTVESDGRQMKQCFIKYIKNKEKINDFTVIEPFLLTQITWRETNFQTRSTSFAKSCPSPAVFILNKSVDLNWQSSWRSRGKCKRECQVREGRWGVRLRWGGSRWGWPASSRSSLSTGPSRTYPARTLQIQPPAGTEESVISCHSSTYRDTDFMYTPKENT